MLTFKQLRIIGCNGRNIFKMKRINWIDWTKVVAIIFVVFGHVPQERGNFLIGYICSFHMPLFFMLSGLLAKPNANMRTDVVKQWHALIKPYLLYNLLFYPYWVVRFLLENRNDFVFSDIIIKPFLGVLFLQIDTPISCRVNGVTWFLAALLVMRMLMNLFCQYKKAFVFQIISAFFVLIIYDIFQKYNLFNNLFMVGFLKCYPFYVGGYLLKKHLCYSKSSLLNNATVALCFYVISLILYFYPQSDILAIRMSMSWLIALTGSFAVIFTCRLLDGFSNTTLVRLSSGTIVIMGLHWMFIGTINYAVEKCFAISDVVYEWYAAVLLTLTICVAIYPLIFLFQRYCPALLGKR